MTVIDDLKTHFEDNWNVLVTPKPSFFTKRKQVMVDGKPIEGLNYVWFFNQITRYKDAVQTGTRRNEDYNVQIIVSSSDSKAKVDLMVSEAKRISHVVVSGYTYNYLTGVVDVDESDRWTTWMYLKLQKYLQGK